MNNFDDLQAQIKDKPELIPEFLRELNTSDEPINDLVIDEILGIKEYVHKEKDYIEKARKEYGAEQFIYEGTPYNYIRYFLNFLRPGTTDILYDLGSGYGRVVLYGALTTESKYSGIEIIPERIKNAVRITQALNIKNAQFHIGNVLNFDFSDGSIFFLFNPFILRTLEKVGARLNKICQNKEIKIVTWGGTSNDYFQSQNWLEEIPQDHFSKIQIFRSL